MPGTIHAKITSALSTFQSFTDARSGKLPAASYVAVLDAQEARMGDFGLNRDQFHLSGRFPRDEESFIDGILLDLVSRNAIPTATYDKTAFTALRARVRADFDHGDFSTYIFPEEERLVFALAEIINPSSLGIFGSYYGYWAIWAMPAIARNQGRATFLDLDERVNRLGQSNFTRMGYANQVEFVTADAVKYLEGTSATYDFALIDAEGPDHHDDPDYRKKCIYYPIFRACVPRLRPHALVAVHNMLLTNPTNDLYFKERIVVNQQQFHKLLPFIAQHFPVRTEYPTSEGVGVYRI